MDSVKLLVDTLAQRNVLCTLGSKLHQMVYCEDTTTNSRIFSQGASGWGNGLQNNADDTAHVRQITRNIFDHFSGKKYIGKVYTDVNHFLEWDTNIRLDGIVNVLANKKLRITGTTTVTADSVFFVNGELEINGNVTIAGAGSLNINPTGVLRLKAGSTLRVNPATFIFESGGTIIYESGATLVLNQAAIENYATLTVDNGATLQIVDGGSVSFGTGSNLSAQGMLSATRTSTSITFTSTGGTSPGSWGSIVISGSGASGSSLDGVTMQYGTQISLLNTSNITIQNSSLQYNINGVYAYYGSSGSILNNTITDPRDHGINMIVSSLTCNQNTITKSSGNNAYYQTGGGIICQSGSGGNLWQNKISGFNWGIGAIWGSSPQFYNENNEDHNNKITNCLNGLLAYQSSWPMVCYPGGSGNGYGFNSIYFNTPYDVYFTSGDVLWAEMTYWGDGPLWNCYFDQSSEYDDRYWLEDDPWLPYEQFRSEPYGYPSLVSKSASRHTTTQAVVEGSSGSPKESRFEGIKLRARGKYKEAKDFFISYLARNPSDQVAYVELFNCYNGETADDIINLFSSRTSTTAKLNDLLLSYLYLKRENTVQAKQICQSVISNGSDLRLTTRASIDQLYFALYSDNDTDGAKAILEGILQKPELSTPMEISLARSALETFVRTKRSSVPGAAGKKAAVVPLASVPVQFDLSVNYPNPFNPSTTIRFALPEDNHVSLKVYDIIGKEVATLVNEQKSAGHYTVRFEASRLSSGIYFYQIQAGKFYDSKKMLLLK